MLTVKQPAGVGFGQTTPTFLKPGDEIVVSVTGLGELKNKVAFSNSSANGPVSQISSLSAFVPANAARSINGSAGLTMINNKWLHYRHLGASGESAPPVIFIHGLGGTMEYWATLISFLSLDNICSLHLFDIEGHGLSPTHPLSVLSIESFAADIKGVCQHAGISSFRPATLFANSMGCLAALRFTLDNPSLVSNLFLLGPPPSPLPEAARQLNSTRAVLARSRGMAALVDAVVGAATSDHSKKTS